MIPVPAAAGRNIKTAAADRHEKEADRKKGTCRAGPEMGEREFI